MRWTKQLIPTLREDPQDAEIASHKLLIRAGLARKLAGGLYTFLPLGLRALRKVEAIIREEMNAAGALEVLMPALQPRELWDTSGRYEVMGDVMFRLKDRQARELVLGPTHEEVITSLVAHELKSHKQLPKTLYQIQTKFRDEIRPRFGLMRAKEFIMKDAYSFDVGWDEADASYKAMYDAYVRIFERCGLRTKIVEADTGAMGGRSSHEFMVLADSGEDGLAECSACDYAANLERAERSCPAPAPSSAADKTPAPVHTPDTRTIEQVATFLKVAPSDLVKTLIYVCDEQTVAALVPGDRELNENKLLRAVGATHAEMADDATVRDVTGAPVGFAGPTDLRIPIFADHALRERAGMIVGGNQLDTHLVNVSMARDVAAADYHDLCTVAEDDLCPRCRQPLRLMRGIEVGHVFKLGTKYSKNFDAGYLDDAGERQPMVMGCYGIGVTRVLQSLIEQCHDKQGIVWPAAVAPYSVLILLINPEDAQSVSVAEALLADLRKRGIDALIDDRDERPGVKFKDADLIGFPVRAVVGERGLAQDCVEVKCRAGGEPTMVKRAEVVEHLEGLCV